MPSLTFPSATFPALTAVELTAPQGWAAVDQGDTVLALVRASEPGQFRANLLVAVRRFPADYTLQRAVEDAEATLATLPDLGNRGGGLMDVAGLPGYAREISFSDQQAGLLAQSIRLIVVPLPGTDAVDVIDVRATVLLAREEPDHAEVISMLETLRLSNS